jgi:hypothetical protein
MMKPGTRRWLKFTGAVVLCCLWVSLNGFAAECSSLNSVRHSAVLANNTADGGHVLKHITGAIPPAPYSQRYATMFADAGQYTTIWNSYATNVNGVDCRDGARNGTTVSQQVPVSQLQEEDTLEVCQCGANVSNRRCQRGFYNFSSTITFVFRMVNDNWILLTAYPLYGDPTTDLCVGSPQPRQNLR